MPPDRPLNLTWPVWALATAQCLCYACLYFLLAGLVLFLTRDLGWAKSTLALGPMVSLLMSAALTPYVGRLVDSGRGPEAMVAGATLGGLMLIALSQATSPAHWIAAWAVAGVAQALCQYEACFAFLIRRLGPASARPAIIKVTLLGGLSSTVALPSYAFAASLYDWRTAVLGAAILMLVVVVPLNYLATRLIRQRTAEPQPKDEARTQPLPPKRAADPVRTRRRWLLTGMFAFTSLNQWMIVSFIVPILVLQGYSDAQAVVLAALMGPCQIVGRVFLMTYESRVSNTQATIAVLLFTLCATVFLCLSGIGTPLAFGYVALQGLSIGTLTILRPVLIADVMGAENYGATAGAIQGPSIMAGALAPMVGALTLEHLGLPALLGLSFCLCFGALFFYRQLRRLRPGATAPQ